MQTESGNLGDPTDRAIIDMQRLWKAHRATVGPTLPVGHEASISGSGHQFESAPYWRNGLSRHGEPHSLDVERLLHGPLSTI